MAYPLLRSLSETVTTGNWKLTQEIGGETQPVHLSTKKRAFRITGIPHGKSCNEVKQLLKKDSTSWDILKASKPAFKLFLYPSTGGNYQVGILILTAREDLLNRFVSGNAKRHITWDDEEIDISVDCHFQGLTPLNNCDEPIADLVAVTGLAGHAWGSWAHKETRRMWLHDFWGKECSSIRIMTYGYNTELQEASSSNTSIMDIVKGLLRDVQLSRRNLKDSKRPLIFVGHSLGGIIVVKALAACSRAEYKEFMPISDATQLLLLFGVPHRGMETSDFRLMVEATKHELQKKRLLKILDALDHDSYFLEAYREEMAKVLGPPRQVISFYETRLSEAIIKTAKAMKFACAGDYINRLQNYSSQICLPAEKRFPVDADHSNMAKFDHGADTTYQTILSIVNDVLEKHMDVQFKRVSSSEDDRSGVDALSGMKDKGMFEVPITRNPHFVDRDRLQQLESLLPLVCESDQKRAALIGLGGTGKTTIATEYCYRQQERSPHLNIFWIRGSSQDSLATSFREIAEVAKIIIPENADENTLLRSVRRWFDSSDSGNWLMVIDNLDDTTLGLHHHIPQRRGRILFTSRDGRIGENIAWGIAHAAVLELTQMSSFEADQMCKRMGLIIDHNNEDDLKESIALTELLGLIEYLPLAIAQAVAYIVKTRGKSRISDYLKLFKKSADDQERLLDVPLGWSSAVMATWKVTIDQIRRENPVAIDILRFMSMLDPDDIPLELVKKARPFQNKHEVDINLGLSILTSFSLISTLEDSTFRDSLSYRMHRLVSFSARRATITWTEEVDLQVIAEAVQCVMPIDHIANIWESARLVPHALTVLQLMGDENQWWEPRRNLGNTIATIYKEQGEYKKALGWYRQVLKGCEKTLGKEHPSTLDTVHNMALVFDNQGKYEKALEWYRRALEWREKTLGKDHPSTLNTINNMAVVFNRQGEYEKAAEWYRRALEGYEKTLKKIHPSTLHTVHNMALGFHSQDEYEKALGWYHRVLEGYEKTLGEDHPSTLDTVNNMALVFHSQGEYEKALKWYRRALEGCEKTLGKGHPSTLHTVNNMAVVFDSQGEYKKALKWYWRALEGYEKTLGKNHPSTLNTVHNMALVFNRQAEYEKALKWYRRVLEGYEKTLEKDHPTTLNTVHNMALVFDSQGKYEKALKWYRRALEGREKTLRKDHPSTLDTVNNMAVVFNRQGKCEKALELHRRVLEGYEKTLGKEHPSTLDTVNNMAMDFHSQGEYKKALEWYQRALEGYEETLGEDHPSTLDTVNNMAVIFHSQGEYKKALEWHQRALEGRKKTLGKSHPSTLDTVHNMALVFDSQGKYEKALEWYQRALEGYEKTLGKEHPSTLGTVNNIALVFDSQGEYEKALEWYWRGWERTGSMNRGIKDR